jgi:surface protein
MQQTLRGCVNLNDNIGNWDVSSVTNTFLMFRDAFLFNNGGSPSISGWTTTAMTDITSMFSNSFAFNQPINSWDVSNVTAMGGFMAGASSFNQPLNSWDVSSVTTMESMLENATSFNQDIGSWDIGSISNMNNMLNNSGLSCENYSRTLIGWANYVDANGDLPANINLGASGLEYNNTNYGGSPYNNGVDARAYLVGSPPTWSITDAGTC